jgi:hypothetical protein
MSKQLPKPLFQILRSCFYEQWKQRNQVAVQINDCLHRLNVYRDELAKQQQYLEMIADELVKSGDPKAQDYLDRIYPLKASEERPQSSYSQMI